MQKKSIQEQDEYYSKIKTLNIVHYGGETSYYSNAPLRAAEKELLSQLPKGASILDIGCGSGRFSINAAKLGFKVLGIDITPEAIAVCKKRVEIEDLSTVQFEVRDITEGELGQTFDYVFCPRFVINAISTDKHRRQAIDNMYKACKPGGTVFIESFNIAYLGQGPLLPLANIGLSLYRNMRIGLARLTNSKYSGLRPGDIVYPANKAKDASEGYAHLPSIFEINTYLQNGKTASIYEIIGLKKKDLLKPFRYSIWTIDRNVHK